MAGETIITVIGNLTRDPELRFTPSGAGVAKFSIASTPRTLDRQSGEWKDGEPMFLDCSAWRDMAEHVAESLTKGDRVIAQGRLKQETWEDKNGGGKRSRLVLEVDEIGPSLRFAEAKPVKAAGGTGTTGRASAGGDPWVNSGSRETVGAATGSHFDDEPPF